MSFAYHSPAGAAAACNAKIDPHRCSLQRGPALVRRAALPPPLRRSQQRCSALRPAALFGFGSSKPAEPKSEQQAPVAPPTGASSPLLIPYSPIQKTTDYSLRLYEPYPAAEIPYQRRDEGFLLLGSYMSGSNADGVRCRETQPIVMGYQPQGAKKMQVYIVPRSSSSREGGSSDGGDGGGGGESPAAAGGALPPAPTDPQVSLTVAGGELIAARQFEGNATQGACEACLKQLLAALARDGLALAEAEAGGYFRLAQYGPLHSLSTRVNEIWVAVKLG